MLLQWVKTFFGFRHLVAENKACNFIQVANLSATYTGNIKNLFSVAGLTSKDGKVFAFEISL